MAVELRCPDCRAKLRLREAPEPGTEIECPKCGTAFAAPEPEPEEDESPRPRKKEPPAEKGGRGDKAGKARPGAEKAAKKEKGPKDPKGPRKRRAKKKETSKLALFLVIGAGTFLLIFMGGMLIWFFTRTSKAVEMFYYVPEDAQVSGGINLGHAQKYPEFYKSVKTSLAGTDYQAAADAIAKAAETDMEGLVDYMVRAESTANGWAVVFRTKADFDGGTLAKLPSARKKTAGSVDYYVVPNLLAGGKTGLAFTPTKRFIVVCPESLESKGEFKNMVAGHPDSRDKTLGVRMGALGKRITRGTFWQMTLFEGGVKPQSVFPPQKSPNPPPGGQPGGQPPAGGSDDPDAAYTKVAMDALSGAKGFGVKASIGSRDVRFEMAVWYEESDKPSELATKQKESELGKGDSGEPPKWFKQKLSGWGLSDRKVYAQLLSNVGFGSSGGVFYVHSEAETIEVQKSASSVMLKVSGQSKDQNSGNPGGAPGGGPGAQPRRRWVRERVRR